MSGEAPGPPLPEDLRERLVTVVHDLRTPLTVADGFAGLLLDRLDTLTPEEVRDFATRIKDATVDLRRILDEERATRPPA